MNQSPPQFENRPQELAALENLLRNRELLHPKRIQNWLNNAHLCQNPRIYSSLIARIRRVLEEDEIEARRKPDSFRPYCPEALSKSGSLHLLTQTDDVKICIDPNTLVTGLGIIGLQGSGKSWYLTHLCSELKRIDPNIRITVINPKGAFSHLNWMEHIDLHNSLFDLMPSANSSLTNFVHELMPLVSDTAGLIYGLDILNQAEIGRASCRERV